MVLGQMPPARDCRIFVFHRAARRSAARGDRRELHNRVPPGTILIRN